MPHLLLLSRQSQRVGITVSFTPCKSSWLSPEKQTTDRKIKVSAVEKSLWNIKGRLSVMPAFRKRPTSSLMVTMQRAERSAYCPELGRCQKMEDSAKNPWTPMLLFPIFQAGSRVLCHLCRSPCQGNRHQIWHSSGASVHTLPECKESLEKSRPYIFLCGMCVHPKAQLLNSTVSKGSYAY